ncbi:MAG: hypothetical protein H6733_12995 [Alphaproteobacteria bacterium]|nr:hypothetical protein [Alphaproteobacteria bacterium]
MRLALALIAAATLSTGCATVNCNQYFDEVERCTEEATGENVDFNPATIPGFGYCEIYTGPLSLGVPQPDWACKVDAYRDADCTTTEGFNAAQEADNACD